MATSSLLLIVAGAVAAVALIQWMSGGFRKIATAAGDDVDAGRPLSSSRKLVLAAAIVAVMILPPLILSLSVLRRHWAGAGASTAVWASGVAVGALAFGLLRRTVIRVGFAGQKESGNPPVVLGFLVAYGLVAVLWKTPAPIRLAFVGLLAGVCGYIGTEMLRWTLFDRQPRRTEGDPSKWHTQ
jgi:hypothetical protein